MEKRRQPEIIAGRVNSDGSLAMATTDGVVSVRLSTGSYTVTLPAGFRLMAAHPTVNGANGWGMTANAYTERSFNVTTYSSNTATVADTGFAFTAYGVQQ
jgi:hypothetical protein